MIVYISSYRNRNLIEKAVLESGQAVLDSVVEERLEFHAYIKGQINQYRLISKFIVDVSCLVDEEKELIQAFRDFRLLFDETQIIVLAPGREPGDRLLAQLFQMGVYDLLIGEEIELEQKLKESLRQKRTYRESLEFQREEGTGEGQEKERIILQNSILPTFRKITIGVIGTQNRIGVTHHTIGMACFLAAQGYQVAVAECSENPVFPVIAESYEEVEKAETGFRLHGIDFYPGCHPDDIGRIQRQDYHFILIDFGTVRAEQKPDYDKCVRMIAVAGTRAWELDHIFAVFDLFGEEKQQVDYLFNLADPDLEEEIRSNMDGLSVWFAGFHPDYFRLPEKEQEWMSRLFSEYLPQVTKTEVKQNPWWRKVKECVAQRKKAYF